MLFGETECNKKHNYNPYNLDWSGRIDLRKIQLKATFLLKAVDICGALGAKSIFIEGKYYKVPTEQLENASPGIVQLTLEEIND